MEEEKKVLESKSSEHVENNPSNEEEENFEEVGTRARLGSQDGYRLKEANESKLNLIQEGAEGKKIEFRKSRAEMRRKKRGEGSLGGSQQVELMVNADPAKLMKVESTMHRYKHQSLKKYVKLTFRDPDLERDFKYEYDKKSTKYFRIWAFLFLLFHGITFMRDYTEFRDGVLYKELKFARGPSLAVAFLSFLLTFTDAWVERKIHNQFFLAFNLILQSIFMGILSILTTVPRIGEEEFVDDVVFPNAMLACLIVGYSAFRLRMKWATSTGWIIQIIANIIFILSIATDEEDLSWKQFTMNIPFCVFNCLGMITAYKLELTERESFHQIRGFLKASHVAVYERKRGEFLLYNILPERIVQRLRTQPTIAQHIPCVSVMFLCIENLYDITSALQTRLSVQLMNDLFEVCDRRASEFGIEKVKTIQEKYMCVSGAPDYFPDHAQALADMALAVFHDFREMLNRGNIKFTVRAGISSGPIVAGVIGLRKFCWDIWGDTVNTAARMEYPKFGKKISGEIRVSQLSYDLLESTHVLEYHGELDVKGKGLLKTYLLKGRVGNFQYSMYNFQDLENMSSSEESGIEEVKLQDRISEEETKNVLADVKNNTKEEARDSASSAFSCCFGNTLASDKKESSQSKQALELDSKRIVKGNGRTRRNTESSRRKFSSDTQLSNQKRRSSQDGKISRRLSRRIMEVKKAETIQVAPPVWDEEGFISNYKIEPVKYFGTNYNKKAFRKKYFKIVFNSLEENVYWASALYFILSLMEPILIDETQEQKNGEANMGAFVLLRLAVFFLLLGFAICASCLRKYLTLNFTQFLSFLLVIFMVYVSAYLHSSVENKMVLGASYYAPLPIVFCCYLAFAVFNMQFGWILLTVIATVVLMLSLQFEIIGSQITQEENYLYVWLACLLVFGLYVAFTMEFYLFEEFHNASSAQKTKIKAQNEKKEADRLLRNIVPEQLIPRLATFADMSGVASSVENVSILFSDVAGFTAMSEKMEPHQLVNWLNKFFTVFDTLADKYEMEKIKTIGDAYVVCGGLWGDNGRHHPNDMVDMAISLQHYLLNQAENHPEKKPVTLRIGIHVGNVLAGIIGKRKFQYDIFGPSVHIAEEMESSGAVGKVHISQACKDALKTPDIYNFEKGDDYEEHGKMYPTWFVTENKKTQEKLKKMLGTFRNSPGVTHHDDIKIGRSP